MKRMNSGLSIAISGVLAAFMACLGLFCAPVGINDPQSSAGFFALALYFFIQTLLFSFTVRFDGTNERSLSSYLAHGINKLCAMVSLLAFAAPHPQFTGVALWVGVSILFLSSGAKDICHVGYSVAGDIRNWWVYQTKAMKPLRMDFGTGSLADERNRRESFDAELDRYRLSLGLTNKKEQEEQAKKAKIEDSLLADLSGFLADTDSSGHDRK